MITKLRSLILLTLLALISTFSFAQGTIDFTTTGYTNDADFTTASPVFTTTPGSRAFQFNYNNGAGTNYTISNGSGIGIAGNVLFITGNTSGDKLTITDNVNAGRIFKFNSFVYVDYIGNNNFISIKGFLGGTMVASGTFDASATHLPQTVNALLLDPAFGYVDKIEITDNGGAGISAAFDDFNISAAGIIQPSAGSISAVSTTYGTASAPTNFDISANGLLGDITLTPPAGFELSLTSGSGYATSLTVTAAADGSVASATIYVRLPAFAAVNTYSGTIVASASGASNVNIATTSSTVTAAPLTITTTGVSKVYGITITGTTGSSVFTATGFKNGDNAATVDITYGTGAASSDPKALNSGTITTSNLSGGSFAAGNYTIYYQPADITVTAAPLSITATDNTNKPYGTALTGASGSGAFISSGLQNGETIGTVTLAYNAGFSATASVRTYGAAIIPSAATGGTFDPNNYNITYGNGNLTVTAVALTVTASSTTKTYGTILTGGAGSSAFGVTGLVSGDAISTVTIAYSAGFTGTDNVAGSPYVGAVTASLATGGNFSASNYTITYNPGDVIVTAAALVITASNTTKTFGTVLSGGTGKTAFGSTGLQNGETIGSVTLSYSGGDAGTATVAGSPYAGAITATAATGGSFSAANYSVTYNPGNVTVTLAPLTIIANDATKPYGTLVTGAAGSTAFTATGLQNTGTESITSVTLAYNAGFSPTASARTYGGAIIPSVPVGAGGFDITNYTPTFVHGNLTVTPIALSVTASNTTKIYGTVLTGGSGSTAFTVTGLANADGISTVTIGYTAGASGTASVAGSPYVGAVTASLATGGSFSASNYTITYNNGDVTVTAKGLTITASNTTKSYGTALTDGAGKTAFGVTGLVNGETFTTVTLAYTAGAEAISPTGSYPATITPSLPAGGTLIASNYTITFAAGNLTVTPAALTIAASNTTKIFGTALIDGPGFPVFSSTGLQNGEIISTVSVVYSAGFTATAPATTYVGATTVSTPTGAGGFLATNYTITYTPGDITVARAPLTITASPVSKVYGTTLSTVVGSGAFSATGLVNADAISGVTITYGTGSAATAVVFTNTLSVTPSAPTGTATLSNYTITFVSSSLYVTPKALTITGIATKVYGLTLTTGTSTFGFTATGLANSEVISSTLTTYSSGYLSNDAVGTYTNGVTPSAPTVGPGTFLSSNYNIAYVAGDVTVTRFPATIAPLGVIKTYGVTITGTAGYTQFTVVGSPLRNGETIASVTAAFGTGSAASATVGVYTGTTTLSVPVPGAGFALSNYSLTFNSGPINVVPAAITITANDITKSYGTLITGAAGSSAFTVTALANGEVITGVTTAYGTGSAITGTVGTHSGAVTLSQPTGTASASNYSITYVPGNIIVNAVPLTITANPVTKTYGTVNSNGSSTAFTATGLVNGEVISNVTITYGPGGAGNAAVLGSYPSDVAPSAATGGGSFTTTNYNIAYVPAGITVNSAPLTLTATDVVKPFGTTLTGQAGYTSFTSTALKNGEIVPSVTVAYGAGASATATAGAYPGSITISSAAAGGTFTPSNYSIGYVNGQILIGDPFISTAGSIAAMTTTYGTSSAGVSFSISGTNIVSGGIVVTAPTGFEVSSTSSTAGFAGTVTVGTTGVVGNTPIYIRIKATTFVGTYSGTVTVATAGATSLTVTVSSGTVSTTPLTITTNVTSKQYGTTLTGASGSTAFTSTGLKNGETIGSITIAYGGGNSTFSPVTIYPGQVTPSAATGGTFTASNYSITYVSNNLIVLNSTDARLSTLLVSSGTYDPFFDGSTTIYTVQVGNAVTVVNFTPTVQINVSTVKVNGVTVASGAVSNNISLTTGNNVVKVVVTAQDGTTTLTYTINVNREKSSNANLSALASSIAFTPAFATGTTAYSVSVANAVTGITLTPTVTDPTASVTVNGISVTSGTAANVNLAVGTNIITTLVTAENGVTTKSYITTVTRAPSANADLSGLVIGAGTYTPVFAGGTLAYTLSVANSVNNITIRPTLAEVTATVTVNGVSVTNGTEATVNLSIGSNTITTLATAQDGVTTKSYVLTVTRAASSNSNLAALAISIGSLSPAFTSVTSSYNVSVANAVTAISVTPTAAEISAGIKVNGKSVTSGTSSGPITLNIGSNDISIVVTAQDGTTKAYTVTVSRDAITLSSNAGLSTLAVSTGALAPAFATATTAYTVTLATDAVTSITLTPTAAEITTVITVNGVSATSGAGITVAVPDDLSTITIKMVASDGTVKTYTVTVSKPKTTWKGVITGGSWTENANWTNGVPDATKLTVIGKSNISPVVTGTVTVGSMNIASGVIVTIDGNTSNLQVTGNVVNQGTFSGTGIVTCTGTATQTFSGTGTVNNLTINNGTRVSIAPGAGNTMSLAGVLTIANGTFSTGSNLVLLSTASQTASVAPLPGNTLIDGPVTVQRWFTGQRGFRVLGSPINGVLPLSELADNFAITGPGPGFTTGLGYSASSVFSYDSVAAAAPLFQKPLSVPPFAVATPVWSVARGLMIMVRGKGDEGLSAYPLASLPTAFAADVKGPLNQGAISYVLGTNATNTSFNLVGNPYAAPINIKLLKNNNGTLLSAVPGVVNTIYVYNPTKNAGVTALTNQEMRGGMDAYTNDGSTDIIIPSMGAFFVQAKGAGNVVKFDESVKAAGSTPLALMGAGDPKVSKLTLQVENSRGSWDDLKIRFESNGTAAGTDNYDGLKLNNELFDFYSIASDERQLTIDSRNNTFSADQVIPLGIRTGVVDKTFRFKVADYSMPTDVTVYLHDKLLNKEEPLRATGDTYAFELTADTATGGNNRFELIVKAIQKTVTPVTGDVASEEDVRFMPNPFKETLSIKLSGNMVSSTGVTRVRLLDMNGRPVKSASYAPNTSQIQMNTADITVGIYLVEISNDKNTIIKKAIKQ